MRGIEFRQTAIHTPGDEQGFEPDERPRKPKAADPIRFFPG